MTARAVYVCDGCCEATVDIPLPDGRALMRLIDALHDASWSTPIGGVWLCPACAAITEINPAPEDTTGELFGVTT